jgi:malate dehydrogenase
MKTKTSIIGAGNVGASLAQLIAYSGLSDVVLFDIVKGIPQGKALDISEACPLWNSSVSVKGTNNYEDTAGSDIVVITAGLPRKPGMSRDDLLQANAEIVRKATEEACRVSPESILIIVTNPMDVMTYLAWKVSGFPPERVMGMGGVLDSARFRTFVAWEFGVSVEDVEALVLGGHGDQMVPMPRFTTVKGVPITELLTGEKIDSLIQRTKNGGAEIVSYLKTGSAYYAPAASVFEMLKSIILDEKRMLPCAAYLSGQYGINDIYAGVPVVLGRKGVEKIVELKLEDSEKKKLEESASAVRNLVEKLGL